MLQVFDDGNFSEDNTFLLTDWTAHIPKEVLAKSFQLDISAFDHIPEKELYIFPAGSAVQYLTINKKLTLSFIWLSSTTGQSAGSGWSRRDRSEPIHFQTFAAAGHASLRWLDQGL